MADRPAEEDRDDCKSQQEQGVEGSEDQQGGGSGGVEEWKGEEGVEGCERGLRVHVSILLAFLGEIRGSRDLPLPKCLRSHEAGRCCWPRAD